jgi:hypothetical protein
MRTDDNDDTFARFSIDDSGDLWLWFDQPVQRFRLRRSQAEHLHAMLDTEFGKPSVLLGDSVVDPGALRVGNAYLAFIEANAPLLPAHKYTMFISHSVSVDADLLAKALAQ